GRALEAFAAALDGRTHLTRPELGAVLARAKISPEGQRLPHLLLAAEIAGVITSGPRRGKQVTYALLDERAPKTPGRAREEALTELTRRYFRSHGPAQAKDLAWWSGLGLADVRAGIAMSGRPISRERI